jgi:hypothetical protein
VPMHPSLRMRVRSHALPTSSSSWILQSGTPLQAYNTVVASSSLLFLIPHLPQPPLCSHDGARPGADVCPCSGARDCARPCTGAHVWQVSAYGVRVRACFTPPSHLGRHAHAPSYAILLPTRASLRACCVRVVGCSLDWMAHLTSLPPCCSPTAVLFPDCMMLVCPASPGDYYCSEGASIGGCRAPGDGPFPMVDCTTQCIAGGESACPCAPSLCMRVRSHAPSI